MNKAPHIWIPNERILIRSSAYLCLFDALTGRLKQVVEGKNLVTDAGEQYYNERLAQQIGGGPAPTNTFGVLELGTAGAAPASTSDRSNMTTKVASSEKVFDSGYPKTNDADVDNTGAGVAVLSYRVSYTTAEANGASIDRFIITNATPGASEPVLSYGTFAAAVSKTGADTLKAFVNHTLAGV